MIEGTVPAIVLQRCDSPNLSPPALSAVYTLLPDCPTEQAGRGVGESHPCQTMAGAVPSITNIYSLVFTFHMDIFEYHSQF